MNLWFTEQNASKVGVVQIASDVSVTKTCPPTTSSGTNFMCTITVANSGPANATNVTLDDTVPTGTTFVGYLQSGGPAFSCSAPSTGSSSGTLHCSISSLVPNSPATFQVTFAVPSSALAATIHNTAVVASDAPDTNALNDTQTTSTQIVFGPMIPTLLPPALACLALMMALIGLASIRR